LCRKEFISNLATQIVKAKPMPKLKSNKNLCFAQFELGKMPKTNRQSPTAKTLNKIGGFTINL
jgi:hypothetical protein